ncbi:protein of unknown function [endosymbiont DhMRE of Dentiscutata heterogama]|uniref:hypothetical protein n=1 Tax=endosymbiont DhMRE of Dentiscutata heterogama TaxID=1609546 RepID=UPI000629D3CE|nr:hypothetical protein [endosymbiont DhMRE of Dentiscutata heterogama]CFW92943.1 protein of unknown function [endosymbiont DhMRE of Dentiscutata heterogama]
MKWQVKNCKECFKYQNDDFFRKNYGPFCPWHEDKEYQPPAIIKKIKERKKELRVERIVWGIYLPLLTLAFCFVIYKVLIFWIFAYGFLWFCCLWTIKVFEKRVKEDLKELRAKKNEWIRVENKENKPKNHKTIEMEPKAEENRVKTIKSAFFSIDFCQKEIKEWEAEALKWKERVKTSDFENLDVDDKKAIFNHMIDIEKHIEKIKKRLTNSQLLFKGFLLNKDPAEISKELNESQETD